MSRVAIFICLAFGGISSGYLTSDASFAFHFIAGASAALTFHWFWNRERAA